MKLQPVLKENLQITGFRRNDKKMMTTLKLRNYSFIKPFQKVVYYSHDKASIHKPKLPKTSRLPGNYLGRLTLLQKQQSNDTHQNSNFNLTIINYKNKQNTNCQKGKKIIQNSCNFIRSDGGKNIQTLKKKVKATKQHEQKVNRFFSLDLPNKQPIQLYKKSKKNRSALEAQNLKKRNQKIYYFDFENLYKKNQSQTGSLQKNKFSYQSPRGRFKVQILQKINKNTNNFNSKTRNVYDQFNLNYIIDKRKSLNQKNQPRFAGSNNPYFQSFISQQEMNDAKNDLNDRQIASFPKTQRDCHQLQKKSVEFSQNYQQISNSSHKIQKKQDFFERKKQFIEQINWKQKTSENSGDQYCENYQNLIGKMNEKFLSVRKILNPDTIS